MKIKELLSYEARLAAAVQTFGHILQDETEYGEFAIRTLMNLFTLEECDKMMADSRVVASFLELLVEKEEDK